MTASYRVSAERNRLKSGAGTCHFGFKRGKGLFDVLIAFQDFELIAVLKLQRRLQGKEM